MKISCRELEDGAVSRGESIGLMLREGECAKKDGRCTLGIMASVWGGVALEAETEKDTLTTIEII